MSVSEQKYGTSRIKRKLFSFKSNNCTYLNVHNDVWINQQNNKTYDLQSTRGKIMMMRTIITKRMSMHFSTNMFKSKWLYEYIC